MKHISESIIGKRGGDYKQSKTPGDLYPKQALEYGDIIVPSGMNTFYIYLPVKQCGWWDAAPRVQKFLVRYSPSNIYRACYFYNLKRRDYKFIRYIREYQNIKTPEDLKRIFDKYNIPYE